MSIAIGAIIPRELLEINYLKIKKKHLIKKQPSMVGEIKRIFRDVDTDVEHSYNLPLHHSPGLQGLLSPTNLLG